jgi:hypothetical protein
LKTAILNALTGSNNASIDPYADFHAQQQLFPGDLCIEVAGLGVLQYPLDSKTIQQLLEISSQSKFGLREKTLLDTKVRDTNEISPEKLNIQYNQQAFDEMLAQMASALGLSERAKLTAHLHNLLIYSPGQFFKEHQDTEKLTDMVATLVVVLPSAHIGGDLLIKHKRDAYTFASENIDETNFQCVAFYADSPHEVKKVTKGYRVALTYNLVLEAKPCESSPTAENLALIDALEEYFCETFSLEGPSKLVYFLNHSYTEHSLKWNMLKGEDFKNADSLRSAAKKAGLVAHLALAELQESWSVYENYDYSSRRYRRDYDDGNNDDDEDDEGNDDEEFEKGEFIEDSTTLSDWIDAEGKKLQYGACGVESNEICLELDTEAIEPDDSQHEGYMGNYGNTVDYWYRRAAVVLWREVDDIAMQFQLDHAGSLSALVSLTQTPGNEDAVLSRIYDAKSFFLRQSRWGRWTENFSELVQIVCYLKDQEYAYQLLEKFSSEAIYSHAKSITQLQKAYGIEWCVKLIKKWMHCEEQSKALPRPCEQLVVCVEDLIECGVEAKIIHLFLSHQLKCASHEKQHSFSMKMRDILDLMTDRISIAKGLLHSAGLLQDSNLIQECTAMFMAFPVLYPVLDLAEALCSFKHQFQKDFDALYGTLRDYVLREMHESLKKGVRNPADVAINGSLSCKCADCKTAEVFLHSSTESEKIWPIAQHRRQHIMDMFECDVIPVALSEKKEGSPHKLVMLKNKDLYARDQAVHEKLKSMCEKLQGV